MDDLARLLAYQEIRQLASHYAVALDARDLDRLAGLFMPDVQVGRDRSGREALRESFDQQLRAIGVSFLLVGSHAIDLVSEEEATGVVYCKAEIQDGERWIHQAIQYHDRYARRDGHWYFVRRKHLLVYGLEQPASPLDQPSANWPERHDGRGSVPQSLASWQQFWGHDPP
ncbi:MAG: hypothetical protein CL910_22580 [Deltaproteobacteria bacterium]|jgi:ketosteroid isomerase-like protein|nr:hypothetical protein [Deltaproteobacteria bacterium]